MNIFVPFTKLRAETYAALQHCTFVPLLDKQWSYGEYFQDRWADEDSFINVEHDVVPTFELLHSMWLCPSPFCYASYVYPGQPDRRDHAYLGCCKISKYLIRSYPNLFSEPTEWTSCEGKVFHAANEIGCCHGDVLHLHLDSNWPLEQINRYG